MDTHLTDLMTVAKAARAEQERNAIASAASAGVDEERMAKAEILAGMLHLEMVACFRTLSAAGFAPQLNRDVVLQVICDRRTVKVNGPCRDPSVTVYYRGSLNETSSVWTASESNKLEDLLATAKNYGMEMMLHLSSR